MNSSDTVLASLITMVRPDLENVPDYPLPESYAVRWYQAGDERHWNRIERLADEQTKISPDLYRAQFGFDEQQLTRRQCFVVGLGGEPIATATAWFDANYQGAVWGRVHWVAIVQTIQGQGLANPLLSVVCRRLRFLGHERAYLKTFARRIPAINLYLKFGFLPEIASAEQLAIWRAIEGKLKYPLHLPERFSATDEQS